MLSSMSTRAARNDGPATFRAHRQALARRLPEGLILLVSAPEVLRNGDVHFPYRQASDFLYLTGVQEPGYALLLDPARGREALFVPRLTQQHAVWMGHIPSREEAREAFGIREVLYREDLAKVLKKWARGKVLVHSDGRARAPARRTVGATRVRTAELKEALQDLRILKTPGELALLRRASAATAAGHITAMRVTRPGLHEYEVQAELEREFQRAGCPQLGYGSIVAGGRRSAVLHYHANRARLGRADLLLIDAGAECRGYTADVTRTFPVSGRFTRRQRDVYEVVLEAQNRVIDHARAGRTSMELQVLAEKVLAEGLRSLGFLKGSTDELLETEAIRVFFPHGIGHTLGLDVHDVQGGKKRRLPKPRAGKLRFRARLEPGFVITVEPGVYFIAALLHDPDKRRKHNGRIDFALAERFLDFGGVRIEDDVVVRREGPPENLTPVPKSVADVEAACAEGRAAEARSA
jgi:Xaa-Pro aminopeptidase